MAQNDSDGDMNENIYFQAYSTVVLAAEGNDPDSEHFGKVDEVKQYPSRKKKVFLTDHFVLLLFVFCSVSENE